MAILHTWMKSDNGIALRTKLDRGWSNIHRVDELFVYGRALWNIVMVQFKADSKVNM